MKKFFMNCATLFMVAMMSVCLASCSSDDEPSGGGGSTSASLGNKKVSLSHAYYEFDGEMIYLVFFSYDVRSSKVPSTINYFSIEYKNWESSSQREIKSVVVPASRYSARLALDLSEKNPEGSFYGESDGRSTSESDLKITRDGDKITVKIEKVNIYGYDDDNKGQPFTFNYSGPILPLPQGLIE